MGYSSAVRGHAAFIPLTTLSPFFTTPPSEAPTSTSANPHALINLWKCYTNADDTGIISSTLLHLSSSLSPSSPPIELPSFSKSLITSSTSFAALLVSPLSGHLADTHGRKPAIYVADILFVIGALWQAASRSVVSMVVGRFIVGLGIGVGSGVVPMYIAELAPAAYRGRLTTLYTGCITFGQLVAYAVGWWTSSVFSEGIGWRVGVGLGAFPALVQAVGLLWQPESPRWLVMQGRTKEAREVLRRVLSDGSDDDAIVERLVDFRIREISSAVTMAHSLPRKGSVLLAKFMDLWHDKQGYKALLVVCMLQGLQQFCGFNSVMYFSATIFAMIGFENPTATSMLVAGTNLMFTFVAFGLIDRVGRRRILLASIPGMVLGLLLSAFAFAHMDISLHRMTGDTGTNMLRRTPPPYAVLILLSLTLYVASYALGIGTVPWTAQSEIFKMEHRGLGNGIATAVNWAGNFLVGITFLGLLETLGGATVFLAYAVVCAAGWVGVRKYFGERGGRELEEEVDEEEN